MNFEHGKDFEQNMNQLVHLLKKIIKNLPFGTLPNSFQPKEKEKDLSGVNLNICFFNFIPMNAEDMEEFDDLYDQFMAEEERSFGEFNSELSASDLDFLRRNGIRF